MASRRGERIGWAVGWLGATAWVAVASVVLLARSSWAEGLSGLALAAAVAAGSLSLAPWRHPQTRAWRLLLPLVALLLASVPWALWAWPERDGALSWWSLLWLLPLLVPLASIAGMRWADREPPAAPPHG